MNVVDIGIISITFVSCCISVIRGLIKEVVSLSSWVLAFIFSSHYAGSFSEMLQGSIGNKTVSFAVALVTIFVFVLVLGLIINCTLGFILSRTGLGPFDKALGIFFGFLRAVIIICILVFIGMVTDVKNSDLWQDSDLIPNYIQVINWLGMDNIIDINSIKNSGLDVI